MKTYSNKLMSLAFAGLTLLVSSCSNDDDANTPATLEFRVNKVTFLESDGTSVISTATLDYDTQDRLLKYQSTSDPFSESYDYVYDQDGNLTNFSEYFFTYGSNDQIATMKLFDDTLAFSYNSTGQVASILFENTDASVTGTHSFIYDTNNRLSSINSFQNNSNTSYRHEFTYDSMNRLSKVDTFQISGGLIGTIIAQRTYSYSTIANPFFGIDNQLSNGMDILPFIPSVGYNNYGIVELRPLFTNLYITSEQLISQQTLFTSSGIDQTISQSFTEVDGRVTRIERTVQNDGSSPSIKIFEIGYEQVP